MTKSVVSVIVVPMLDESPTSLIVRISVFWATGYYGEIYINPNELVKKTFGSLSWGPGKEG